MCKDPLLAQRDSPVSEYEDTQVWPSYSGRAVAQSSINAASGLGQGPLELAATPEYAP
jgi:hypothetical protein